MKSNINRYYVGVGSVVYSISKSQWNEFKKMRDDNTKDRWDDALDYIVKTGKCEFELDGNYHYK